MTQEVTTTGFSQLSLEKSAELAAIAVAAAAKAEVESAYVMAERHPRNEEEARARIKRACMDPLFAKKARYQKPVGTKLVNGRWEKQYVVGPSIRFAEEMLRSWRNVLTQQTTIYDDATKRVVKITVRDLEANVSYSKEILLEKTVERRSGKDRQVLGQRKNSDGVDVYIVVATEDELAMKEAAQASKIIRNNGLRFIPQHIIDEALMEVDRVLREKIAKDPDAERRELVDGFMRRGITVPQLEGYTGSPVAQWSVDQMAELRDILTSIEDGHATWQEFVEASKEQQLAQKSQVETKGAEIARAAEQPHKVAMPPAQPKEPAKATKKKEPQTDDAKPEEHTPTAEEERGQTQPSTPEPAAPKDAALHVAEQVSQIEAELMGSSEGLKAYRQLWTYFRLPQEGFGKNGAGKYLLPQQLPFFLRQIEKALNEVRQKDRKS
jgi:hypothetical protein